MFTKPITLNGKKIPCHKCEECKKELITKWIKNRRVFMSVNLNCEFCLHQIHYDFNTHEDYETTYCALKDKLVKNCKRCKEQKNGSIRTN